MSAAPCTICGGDGWVYSDVGLTRCVCDFQRIHREAITQAGQPARFGFDRFDAITPASEFQAKASSALSAWLSGWNPTSDRGLLLIGPPEGGKTHLAAAMFREVLWKARNLRNYTALWYRTSDLLDREKRGYGEGDDSPLYEARRASILLLDDLGVERVTDWVREQIDLLIDGRYSACLPTIMTSNLSLSTLAKPEYYGSRVTSRIQQTCDIIAIRGGGLRSKAVNS